MISKRLQVLALLAALLFAIPACQKYYAETEDDNDNVPEDPADYTWDTSSYALITLSGTSVTVDPANAASISGTKVTILKAGTYKITGSLTDGQIIVNSQDDANVRIILSDAVINCSNSAPIFIEDAYKTIINLADGTTNSITDGTSYVTDNGEPNAALFSNSDLSVYGKGSLAVTARYNDGISSDDGLIIKSGTITVTAADDGIRGKDYVIIRNGNITIQSAGDGIKSDNETSTALGYVTIDSAVMKITATAGDGISAQTNLSIADGSFTITTGSGAKADEGGPVPGGGTSGGYSGTISEKALKGLSSISIVKGTFVISSADDAIHSNKSAVINDGTFSMASGDDAIHADNSITINGGTLNITKSYEGFESASITFNDGNLVLVSTDDAINATMGAAVENNDGSLAVINGGFVVVNSSSGDGLDSNGNLTINGGTVIVHGPQSAPEVGFDVNGTFNMAGGFLIGTGPNAGNMIEAPATSSSQYSIKATTSSTLSSSTLFHIQDASGNDLVTYKPVRTVYYLVFSSSSLANGATYSIYTGGSSTGTYNNGIYTGGTYSGGTLKKTFTVSGKVTSVTF
jgi:hypothetical protein